jgi:hypothetical protein
MLASGPRLPCDGHTRKSTLTLVSAAALRRDFRCSNLITMSSLLAPFSLACQATTNTFL